MSDGINDVIVDDQILPTKISTSIIIYDWLYFIFTFDPYNRIVCSIMFNTASNK